MKIKILIGIVIITISMLFVEVISASIIFGVPNASIEKNYQPNKAIIGWINLSLSNEKIDSIIMDGLGNLIGIIELIEDNGVDYTCFPESCGRNYILRDNSGYGTPEKTFSIKAGENKTIGLVFREEIDWIEKIGFNFTSSSDISCNNQLKIDILNDGEFEWINKKQAKPLSFCSSKNYGCYTPGETQLRSIGQTPYCQRINLNEAPAFRIGAWIKKYSGTLGLYAGIYTQEGEEVENGECKLPDASINGGEVACIVNYTVENADSYYVCIYSKEEGTGDYKIQSLLNPTEKCGFYGFPIKNEVAAYNIFAESGKFAKINNVRLNNEIENSMSFSEIAMNYIEENYNNDCSTPCIVPIRFFSNEEQTITLSNLVQEYSTVSGENNENNFYEIEETSALISMEMSKLSLENVNFSVPSQIGNYTVNLSINDRLFFSSWIFVNNSTIIGNLNPLSAIAGLNSQFEIGINAPEDLLVNEYIWDFGDGIIEKTADNKIMHKYNITGTMQFKVSVNDSKNVIHEKTFALEVISPKNYLNEGLIKKTAYINDINLKLNSLKEPFYKSRLKRILNLEENEDKINSIQKEFNEASENDERTYITLVEKMEEVNIPKSLYESKKISAKFISNWNSIDIETVKNIAGGKYDAEKETRYKNAVFQWNKENLEKTLKTTEFSIKTESNDIEKIIRFFEITMNEKESIPYTYYLIAKNSNSIEFSGDTITKTEGDYLYSEITNVNKKIILSTDTTSPEQTPPVFFSPAISKLPSMKSISPEPTPINKLFYYSLAIVMIILGILAYIIIQNWYAREYEKRLFKSKNDLANIKTYINSSMKKGYDKNRIMHNLSREGWTREQIDYAFKKKEPFKIKISSK